MSGTEEIEAANGDSYKRNLGCRRKGSRRGREKGIWGSGGALCLLFIGLSWRDWDPWRSCKGRAQVEGDVAGTGKSKWQREQSPAGRAESHADADGGVIGPECASPSPRLPAGQEGCGGCREIWGWDGGDKKSKEFLPHHLFFSAKWEELKSSCAYLLAHQTLVIFILFKLLIYSFTLHLSSTCYVQGAVLGA